MHQQSWLTYFINKLAHKTKKLEGIREGGSKQQENIEVVQVSRGLERYIRSVQSLEGVVLLFKLRTRLLEDKRDAK